MPRFYFSIYNGHEDIDDVGTELTDFDAVRLHALQIAARFCRGQTEMGLTTSDWKMEVTNDRRHPLFILSFSDAGVPWILREPEPGGEIDGIDD